MARSSRVSSQVSVLDVDLRTKRARADEPIRALASPPSRLQSAPVHPALEFGRVVNVEDGRLFVMVASMGGDAQPARCVEGISVLEPGDDVVVALVGEPKTVVVLGRLIDANAAPRDVRVNGRRVTVDAQSELVLQCASATIRIRRDGSIAVRGDRVTSQARTTHRIRGGSVELN